MRCNGVGGVFFAGDRDKPTLGKQIFFMIILAELRAPTVSAVDAMIFSMIVTSLK